MSRINLLGNNTEKKLRDIIATKGYGKFRELGIGIFKDEKPDFVMPHFSQVVKETKSTLEKRNYRLWLVTSKYGEAEATTKIHFVTPYDPTKPIFIFQHGFGGTNHLAHLVAVIGTEFFHKFNVVSLGLNGHTTFLDMFGKCTNTFTNLTLTAVSSIHSIEECINFHKSKSSEKVILSGASLGGMIVSWHGFLYNTADLYFPLISHPNIAKVFLSKSFAEANYSYDFMCNNKSYFEAFTVESSVLESMKSKMFPILGKIDELVPFTDTSEYWEGFETLNLDAGHYSIVLQRAQVQEFMLNRISKLYETT